MTTDTWLDGEPTATLVTAGAFSFLLRADTLADVRFDGTLLVRSVRFIVRDRDWSTVPARVTGVERVTTVAGSTRFAFHVRCSAPGIDFTWAATVQISDAVADAPATMRFTVNGLAGSAFERNRIGIIVLHPPTVAGGALVVHHPESPATTTAFPVAISPHQPARDIAGLEWTADGVNVAASFTGDTFEMEDQRNWTDGSFKTYSTPLSVPFPVAMRAGDTVRQSVVFSAARVAPARVSSGASAALVRQLDAPPVFPQVQVGASTAPGEPPARPEWLRTTAVLVELDAGTTNWRAALARATAEANGAALDVRIVATADQLGAVLDAVLDAVAPLAPARLGIFDRATHASEPELWGALVEGAAARSIGAELVGGVRSHFTELNRNHGRLPVLPAVTFSVTPQMHDLERAQVVESLGMQRLVAVQAVAIAAGAPVHVGPVTLRARFNAVATSPRPVPVDDDLRAGYGAELVAGATDPRQRSNGFAAWLVASAAHLAAPGVATITFAEVWGDRGLMDASGERFPASHALEWLATIAGTPVIKLTPLGEARDGRATGAVAIETASVTLLANPSDNAVQTHVDAPDGYERLAPGDTAPVRVEGGPGVTIRLAPGEIARVVARS